MKGKNMYLAFGSEVIYDDAEFSIEEKDKVGVVGVNGAGKTTLFKIILKEERLDGGKVTINNKKIGYLPQEIRFEDKEMNVLDYLYSARPIEKRVGKECRSRRTTSHAKKKTEKDKSVEMRIEQ